MENKFLPKIILKIGFIFLQDTLRLKSCKNKISILNKIIKAKFEKNKIDTGDWTFPKMTLFFN